MARAVVIVDNEGRICLPQHLQEALPWKEGTSLSAEVLDSGQLLLHPLEGEPLLVEKDGVLVVRSAGGIDAGAVLETLRAERLTDLTGTPK